MKFRRTIVIIAAIVLSLALLGVIIAVFVGIYVRNNIDHSVDEELFLCSGKSSVSSFYAYTDEGEIKEVWQTDATERRKYCSLDDVAQCLVDAVLSAEDRQFYSHRGINVKRTLAAMGNYLTKSKSNFGGSTLTQQVIKNISGDNDFSVKRKFNEIIRALYLERHHTKDEILEMYLNILPMTDNIYGVRMASLVYFGIEPSELSLTQAATIVGITNSPAKYDPYRHPEECVGKRNRVLYAMLDNNKISRAEYEKATEEPLGVIEKISEYRGIGSWFVETVTEDVVADLIAKYNITDRAARIMLSGGMKIYTTMNPEIQEILDDYFENPLNIPNEINDGLGIAFVVVEPGTGNLLGIIGNGGKKSGNRILNLATVPRAPGSALKPIALYAPLLNEGRVRWSSVFDDVPVTVLNDKPYPRNSPDIYRGLTTLNDALRMSKNTIAVRLYNILGAEKIYGILSEDYGIDTLVRSGKNKDGGLLTDLDTAPLALGQLTRGVTLRKLTESYNVFPTEGILNSGKSYYSVLNQEGKAILINTPSSKRILSTECARIMNQMLMNVTENGTARSLTIKSIVDTAGKTGTSGGDTDKVFVGYTPYLTAGIWMGYISGGRPVQVSYPNHLTMWDGVMKKIHEKVILPGFAEQTECFSTEGLLYLPFCLDSGGIYSENCVFDPRGSRTAYGYFTEDNKPEFECQTHVICAPSDDEELSRLIALLNIDRVLPENIEVADGRYVYRNRMLPEDNGDAKEEPHIEPSHSQDLYDTKKKKKTAK